LAEIIAKKLQKAKKPEIYLLELSRIASQVNKYASYFSLEVPIKLISVLSIKDKSELSGYLVKQAEYERKEKLRKEKELKKAVKESLKKFFNYEVNRLYSRNDEDYCRISKDNRKVETSQGVIIEGREAYVLYKLIEAGKDIKGLKIGAYTVISLNGHLKIGCHSINKKNMHEVGAKLKSLFE